mmetsp:Transcript_2396/g.8603  ORF Transcript_2396/g.8603 Transcript_2396/m.8603 type:complete len:212 (-) Transcript_2396:2756-3391(-)
MVTLLLHSSKAACAIYCLERTSPSRHLWRRAPRSRRRLQKTTTVTISNLMTTWMIWGILQSLRDARASVECSLMPDVGAMAYVAPLETAAKTLLKFAAGLPGPPTSYRAHLHHRPLRHHPLHRLSTVWASVDSRIRTPSQQKANAGVVSYACGSTVAAKMRPRRATSPAIHSWAKWMNSLAIRRNLVCLPVGLKLHKRQLHAVLAQRLRGT